MKERVVIPKVSVIMGIYNTKNKEYLRKSINSVLNQTFDDFEFIICDDGSTNDCEIWAREICKEDKRVIFIRNEKNKGLAYTLNQCLKIAKGKYIARMDDDDYNDLNRFKKQVEILDNDDNVDVVNCNSYIFDNNGVWGQLRSNEIITNEDFLYNNPIVHPAVMARKQAYDCVKGYRDLNKTIRVEDYDVFMRMQEDGLHIITIQEPLYYYREDKETVKRRKFKYRINEYKIRMEHFKKLGLLKKKKNYIYVIKPLVANFIGNKYRRKKLKGNMLNEKR